MQSHPKQTYPEVWICLTLIDLQLQTISSKDIQTWQNPPCFSLASHHPAQIHTRPTTMLKWAKACPTCQLHLGVGGMYWNWKKSESPHHFDKWLIFLKKCLHLACKGNSNHSQACGWGPPPVSSPHSRGPCNSPTPTDASPSSLLPAGSFLGPGHASRWWHFAANLPLIMRLDYHGHLFQHFGETHFPAGSSGTHCGRCHSGEAEKGVSGFLLGFRLWFLEVLIFTATATSPSPNQPKYAIAQKSGFRNRPDGRDQPVSLQPLNWARWYLLHCLKHHILLLWYVMLRLAQNLSTEKWTQDFSVPVVHSVCNTSTVLQLWQYNKIIRNG